MSFTWRMEVKDETFTNLRDHPSVGQDYITPDDGVATLDDFSVDGAGNCLEARFRASPKFVDIRARDIVSLEVSEDDGSTWTPVYRGYVVTAGNPRSQDVQEYKLNGLRQRFFEITNPMINVREKDAAEQAEDVFQDIDDESNWPAGVTQSVPILPSLGFVNGIRHPQKESYGDTLKAIAESVGRFVVPLGGSYTYDGVTYSELETVAATRFGVDASGNVIFARPQADAAVFSETGENVLAEYTQVTGEEVFDTIELVYANEYVTGLFPKEEFREVLAFDPVSLELSDAIPIPLARTFSFGDTDSVRKVVLEAPQALMNGDASVSDTTGTISNASGAVSGGTTTLTNGGVAYETDNTSPNEGFILSFSAQLASSGSGSLSVLLGTSDFLAGTGSEFRYFHANVEELLDDGRLKSFTIPALPFSNILVRASGVERLPSGSMPAAVAFNGVNVEISNVKVFVPDVDAGGTASEQFGRPTRRRRSPRHQPTRSRRPRDELDTRR